MNISQMMLKERVKSGEISADEAIKELNDAAKAKGGSGLHAAKTSHAYGWLLRWKQHPRN